MKPKHLLIILILILGISIIVWNNMSSHRHAKGTKPQDSVFIIPLGKNISNQKVIGLKEMAEDVQYVKLEFTPECPLGRIVYLVATKHYFIVADIRLVYQFSRNGKFIRKIGSIGKGPGEYLGYRDLAVDESGQRIYLQTNWTNEILKYDFNGKFIGSIPLENSNKQGCDYISDSLLAIHIQGIERNSFVFTELINQQGNNVFKVNSSIIKKQSDLKNWLQNNVVYSFKDKVYVKEFFNDTVFRITTNGLVPRFILDLDKYASPVGYSQEDRKNYIMPLRFLESDNWILLFFMYKDKKCVAQYNKETNLTAASMSHNEEHTGIQNDIDNGPNFFVMGIPLCLKTTQNEWLLPFQASNLMKYKGNKNIQGNFKDLIQNLKMEDNPVIMVVKLK